MKKTPKIALIEDRYKRQQTFLEQNNISIDKYTDILENFIEEKASNLLENILNNSFNLQEFTYIICHKSVQNNTVILGNLKDYCKKHQKTLVLFSGGISVNYYDNSEFELLELNSKTFYSQNLVLFLEAVKAGNEDIMMICYGEHWKQNIVANVLEKTNLYIFKLQNGFENSANFQIDANLTKTEYPFYELKEKTLDEIVRFKESLEEYFNLQVTTNNPNQSLIIHHNNVCDLRIFNHRIKFIQSSEEIDTFISNTIIKELSLKECDTIFIKDNLSSNYLELYGFRVAYHIRLSSELSDKIFAPIVIISDFDSDTLNRFTHEANILFTQGIYLCKNTKEDIQKHQSLELQGITNYDEFLSNIEVAPPKDTSGTHDIANKWSIYRWAEFLGAKSDAIDKNRNEVENELYFKYLKALNETQEDEPKKINKPTKKGKVLLIDDEWGKGWADILKTALTKDGLEFKPFVTNYQDRDGFNDLTYKKIASENPDVVILDLRLLESDHENEDIESYSGIEILQKIHEINAGIQVIMLTATSKSTILEKLYEKKILGYIKKEHPEDKSIDTVENINKLVGLVDKGLNRKHLKRIWDIQKEIKQFDILQVEFSFNMSDEEKKLLELKNTVNRIFETLDSNIPKPFVYGMLIIYKCIEIICEYYIYEQYDRKERVRKAYWRNNSQLIDNNGNTSTNNKIKSILKLLQIENQSLNQIVNQISCSRNFEIHSGEIKPECENNVVRVISEEHITAWFEFIKIILSNINDSQNMSN